MRRTVIGVMGGSKVGDEVAAMANRLGRLIAEHGWILLNGGRNAGVMAASAEGARQAGGTVVGVLPDKNTSQASPHLDIAIVTGMSDARNLINVLSSDVVIACPGSLGTLSEIMLALKNGKHVILLDREMGPELEPFTDRGQLRSASTPDEAVELVAAALKARPANAERG
jgi:uncharacterized protein (TIGR00725 family)